MPCKLEGFTVLFEKKKKRKTSFLEGICPDFSNFAILQEMAFIAAGFNVKLFFMLPIVFAVKGLKITFFE